MAHYKALEFNMVWDEATELYTIISADVNYPHKFITCDKDSSVRIETTDTGIEYTENKTNTTTTFTLSAELNKNTVTPNDLYNFIVSKLYKYNYKMGWTNYDENGESILSVNFPTVNENMYFVIYYNTQS